MSSSSLLETVRETDYVQYYIFPSEDPCNGADNEEECILEKLNKDIKKLVAKHASKYLWHKDPFQLNVRTKTLSKLCNENEQSDLPAHLHGITHFGDNIEDEWFIVHILLEICRDMEVIVRVVDSDGEFLLIEASDHLMPWANPDSCDNRVYLYNGHIHIVAPPADCDDIPELSTPEALRLIRQNPALTVASSDIQSAIRARIGDYPAKITTQLLHTANAYLPVSVAAILEQRPDLIAHAVQAFCNRDAIDLRVCRAMKYFPPENRVYRRITFTRCMYAMLSHAPYTPDRITGWNLPTKTSAEFNAHLLGVKVACGFEILIAEAKNSSTDLDKGWHAYLASLKTKDYFGSLMEHSKEYNNLLNKAKEYYISNRESMRTMPSIGAELLSLTKSVDAGRDRFPMQFDGLSPDDSEDWLEVSSEDLDRLLADRYGSSVKRGNGNAKNVSEKLTQFLNHSSTIDGVEFPDNVDAPTRIKTATPAQNGNDGGNNVNFDANAFSCAVKNILNFVIPEDDNNWGDSDSDDMSDYDKEHEQADEIDFGDVSTTMNSYMAQMDKELAQTTIGESFVKTSPKATDDVAFEDIESFKPVDIDVNALQNMLKSYNAQMGEAGPSSNMLGPMGVHFDTADMMNGDSD